MLNRGSIAVIFVVTCGLAACSGDQAGTNVGTTTASGSTTDTSSTTAGPDAAVAAPSCAGVTCSNRGSCSVESGQAICACDTGYAGALCGACATGYHRDTADTCVADASCSDSDPCGAHGTCVDDGGVVSCTCDDGYTGPNCLQCYGGYHDDGTGTCVLDQTCLVTSCSGNGTCSAATGIVVCACDPGHGGAACEHCLSGYHRAGDGSCVADESCQPTSCAPNAVCDDKGGVITCTCKPGYAGAGCATCYGGYHADAGGDCVLDQTCLPTSCSGHGTCSAAGGVVACECDAEYAGDACEGCATDHHRVADGACVADQTCEAGSCGPKGTCDDTGGVVTCLCETGYTGADCTGCYAGYHANAAGDCVLDEQCLPGSCSGVGTCSVVAGVVQCECHDGFSGDHCETKTDYCDPNPCQNGGECVDLVDGYVCICGLEFFGELCEVQLGCDPNPCRNGGTCYQVGLRHICDCPVGWGGLDCAAPTGRISGYFDHRCAIQWDGSALCWGYNAFNQREVPDGVLFDAVGVGSYASCGIERTTGHLNCWSTYPSTSPPSGTYKRLTMGNNEYCALRTDNTVECWGSGPPTPPGGEFIDIAIGRGFACGIGTDGEVSCWGEIIAGGYPEESMCLENCEGACIQDSPNTYECKYDLTPPPGPFASIDAGAAHICALRPDGEVVCWGEDGYQHKLAVPENVSFVQLDLGGDSACGLDAAGNAHCWGTYIKNEPPGPYDAVGTGTYMACGLRSDGDLTCWGDKPQVPAEWVVPSPRTMFVTSQKDYTGALGGLDGADGSCQTLAEAANLSGTYKAWLSSSTVSAKSRLAHHPWPYVRTDGAQIAASWDDLIDGTLEVPINVNENGTTITQDFRVFTNTKADGTIKSLVQHCCEWTCADSGKIGQAGEADATDSTWSGGVGGSGCSAPFAVRLYCIQQ